MSIPLFVHDQKWLSATKVRLHVTKPLENCETLLISMPASNSAAYIKFLQAATNPSPLKCYVIVAQAVMKFRIMQYTAIV